jgi:spoIIIJ-associated protein
VKSAEGSGRTVEEAIRDALRTLGARREDVDLVVLDEGSRGVLGIGARTAHVRLTLLSEMEEDDLSGAQVAEEAAEIEEGADPVGVARSVASSVVRTMGFRATVTARTDGPAVRVMISGAQLAPLIGRHGQTLEALELVVSLIVARRLGHRTLVSVDVERYRERRRDALQALAERTAARVKRTGKAVTLEPMAASERRVIHTALAQDPDAMTHSEGEGPERHIVVSPRSGAEGRDEPSPRDDEGDGEEADLLEEPLD